MAMVRCPRCGVQARYVETASGFKLEIDTAVSVACLEMRERISQGEAIEPDDCQVLTWEVSLARGI
jgi:hypothetical protein